MTWVKMLLWSKVSLAPLCGMTLSFLSERHPLWTPSDLTLRQFFFPEQYSCHVFCSVLLPSPPQVTVCLWIKLDVVSNYTGVGKVHVCMCACTCLEQPLDKILCCIPSKHAGFNLHPIRISLEALARSGPDDSCTPACFWTRSVRPKPDTVSQHQTGASLVLHSMIQAVCGRMQPSLKAGNWSRACCILPETGANGFCTPACFRTGCIWPKPDQAIQIRSELGLHSMVQAFSGKTEPNWMREVGSGIYNSAIFWLHAGHNGHNCP